MKNKMKSVNGMTDREKEAYADYIIEAMASAPSRVQSRLASNMTLQDMEDSFYQPDEVYNGYTLTHGNGSDRIEYDDGRYDIISEGGALVK